MKKQEKTPEKTTKGTEINSLSNKELKIFIIKGLTELGKRIDEHSKNFNKKLLLLLLLLLLLSRFSRVRLCATP